MSNAFDMVRKIRHLPGINLKATIEPQHISKRVKNAAQKMLRSGVLVGFKHLLSKYSCLA